MGEGGQHWEFHRGRLPRATGNDITFATENFPHKRNSEVKINYQFCRAGICASSRSARVFAESPQSALRPRCCSGPQAPRLSPGPFGFLRKRDGRFPRLRTSRAARRPPAKRTGMSAKNGSTCRGARATRRRCCGRCSYAMRYANAIYKTADAVSGDPPRRAQTKCQSRIRPQPSRPRQGTDRRVS